MTTVKRTPHIPNLIRSLIADDNRATFDSQRTWEFFILMVMLLSDDQQTESEVPQPERFSYQSRGPSN